MNIIICGAGEVGSHAAEVLTAEGSSITVIDADPGRLRDIEETMDVATLAGNCAEVNVLGDAGAGDADLVLAATDSDEVNLLTASLAKGLGAHKSVARVHHSAFFERNRLDYSRHFNIDRIICPEYSTSIAIARRLRHPGAVAIENFARGAIEMQEMVASKSGTAVGKRLMDVAFPAGTRLAMVRRKTDREEAFVPEAKTVIAPGDTVILVGNKDAFESARKLFQDTRPPRRRIVLMGGPPLAVWLCRLLRDPGFAIRLFERQRERAEELADKLSWVTVLNADPTDRAVFAEENLSQADVFISLLDSDEENIIAGVLAKTRGVEEVLTVVKESKYLDILYDIGVDKAFSTRQVAADEIDAVLDEGPMRLLGTLAAGRVDVVQVRVNKKAEGIGRALRDLNLSPDWVVAGIQREQSAFVPGADDVIEEGDIVMLVGKRGEEKALKTIFAVKGTRPALQREAS